MRLQPLDNRNAWFYEPIGTHPCDYLSPEDSTCIRAGWAFDYGLHDGAGTEPEE